MNEWASKRVLSLCFVMNPNNQPTAFALACNVMFSLLLAISLLNLVSCSKVPDTNPGNPTDNTRPSIPPDLTTTVTTTVNGIVTHRFQGGNGISGATVTLGNRTVITDNFGYFEFRDVQVVNDAAAISVTKAHFIKTIKTFVASDGKTTSLRLGLHPIDNQGSFLASVGGGHYDSHGMSISIPANAVIDAVTKQPYTGDVILRHRYIVRGGGENIRTPGDDRGIDSLGVVKWLDSYGIASIECVGTGGEILELAVGKKATLTFALLFGTAASAPPAAPMWYFDEAKALWRQQGTAIKSNNTYVAEVSSLSNWNVALPTNLVRFRCTLVDPSLKPIPYAVLRLEEVGSQTESVVFITDTSGQVSGFIPDGRQFAAFLPFYENCLPLATPQSFRTSGSDISLGTIRVPETNIATVSGTLVNCKGEPVTSGYVLLESKGRIAVNSAGQFNFTVVVCGDPVTDYRRIFPVDMATGQTGNSILDTLHVGNNNYGTISTCGTEVLENFSATLQDADGQPLQAVWVKVSNLSYPQNAPFEILPGTTGVITGKLPRNSRFLLEVFSSESCSTPAFTQTFASVTTAVQLGIVTVTGLQQATIRGTVTACNGQAATSGYLLIKKGRKTFSVPLGAGGSFRFVTPICNSTNREAVSLIGLSNATHTISNLIDVNLAAGDNNVGEIKACASPVNGGEFVHYILDGVNHTFVSPGDEIVQTSLYPGLANYNNIRASSRTSQDRISLTLLGNLDATAAGDAMFLDEFNFPGYDRNADYPVPILLTESGSVGQYIAGHVTVNVRNMTNNSIHTVVCIFRVKRRQ